MSSRRFLGLYFIFGPMIHFGLTACLVFFEIPNLEFSVTLVYGISYKNLFCSCLYFFCLLYFVLSIILELLVFVFSLSLLISNYFAFILIPLLFHFIGFYCCIFKLRDSWVTRHFHRIPSVPHTLSAHFLLHALKPLTY